MEDIILFVCCCHQRGGSDVIHFIGHRSDAITWSLEWIFPVSLSRTMRQFTVTSKIGMGGGGTSDILQIRLAYMYQCHVYVAI